MTARPRDVLVVRSGSPRRAAPPARGHCDRCTPPSAFAARRWHHGVCLGCGYEAGVVDLEAAPEPLPAGLPRIRRTTERGTPARADQRH